MNRANGFGEGMAAGGGEGEHSTEFLLTNNPGVTGKGEFIVVLDSTDRENEGDLIIAAEDVTVEKMAFMVRWTRYTPTHAYNFSTNLKISLAA